MAIRKSSREDVVKQLRKLITSTSGKRFALAKIPNDALFGLYQRLRAGHTLNGCADWLMKKSLLKGSHDSCRKMVSKFKSRISPLLIPAPRPEPEAPELPPLKAFKDCNDLEKITQLIDLYTATLNDELTAAQQGAPLNPAASKHAAAISQLLKQKESLQAQEAKRDTTGLTDAEQASFRRTVAGLPDQGTLLCDMARAFISACEGQCVEMPAASVDKCVIH
jgi:hypothetical protein